MSTFSAAIAKNKQKSEKTNGTEVATKQSDDGKATDGAA